MNSYEFFIWSGVYRVLVLFLAVSGLTEWRTKAHLHARGGLALAQALSAPRGAGDASDAGDALDTAL